MGSRRLARECALQILYQLDMSNASVCEVMLHYWDENPSDDETQGFAKSLVEGVLSEKENIDKILSEHSTNWKLSRMASVDKNVLRMATFELIHLRDIPVKVTINEAVEIAKRYGTLESGAFVNGVLDNIARAFDRVA